MSEALGSVPSMLKEEQRSTGWGPAEVRGEMHTYADCHAVPSIHPDYRGPRWEFEQHLYPGSCVLIAGGDSKNVAEPGKGQQRYFQ